MRALYRGFLVLASLAAACGGSSTDDDLDSTGPSAAGGSGGGSGTSGSAKAGSSGSAQAGSGGSMAGAGKGGAPGASGQGGSGQGGSPLACEPGAKVQCLGPGGCLSDQTCLPDGSGYGPCGCGASGAGGSSGNMSGGSAGASGSGAAGGQAGGAGGSGAGAAGSAGSAGSPAPAIVGTCADPRPDGAPPPPSPPPYSGGACPTLVPGENTFESGGGSRKFILVLPSGYDGKEKLPLIFLWHWLGGSANSFLEKGEVQAAADQLRFAAVIPSAKDDPLNVFKWPYSIAALPQQVDDELRFFDDMLSCVSEQVSINHDCVGSMGVSAGALWTDQLAGARGSYLSSIVSLSGGVGVPQIKPWTEPDHKMPAFVLWGGPTDQCVTVQFEPASKNLEQALVKGDHFLVECIHNCAHTEPPLEPLPGFSKYTAIWRFFLEHPYWLAPGTSPWAGKPLPEGTPGWCAIGAGNATMRTGECPEKSSCPI